MLFTAFFGIIIISGYTKGRSVYKTAGLHGIFGVSGLISLIAAALTSGITELRFTAVVIFILVALGGAVLYIIDTRKKTLPMPLFALHGLGALLDFLSILLRHNLCPLICLWPGRYEMKSISLKTFSDACCNMVMILI